MRILLTTTVTAAVLATAFASVRLHHEVIRYRCRLGEMERERERVDRDLRLAVAEWEAAKAPHRLLDRYEAERPALARGPRGSPSGGVGGAGGQGPR